MPDFSELQPGGEISPYLLYRMTAGQIECAIWRLNSGEKALALFLSPASAEAYAGAADLGDGWGVYHPNRADLLAILQQSVAADVPMAVLEPDQQQARELFDLRRVLENAENGPPSAGA